MFFKNMPKTDKVGLHVFVYFQIHSIFHLAPQAPEFFEMLMLVYKYLFCHPSRKQGVRILEKFMPHIAPPLHSYRSKGTACGCTG